MYNVVVKYLFLMIVCSLTLRDTWDILLLVNVRMIAYNSGWHQNLCQSNLILLTFQLSTWKYFSSQLSWSSSLHSTPPVPTWCLQLRQRLQLQLDLKLDIGRFFQLLIIADMRSSSIRRNARIRQSGWIWCLRCLLLLLLPKQLLVNLVESGFVKKQLQRQTER